MTPLLWIEDDAALRRVYRTVLRAEGYELVEADGPEPAIDAMRSRPFDLVLLDLMLPPSGTVEAGLDLLVTLLGLRPEVKVVVVSGAGDKSAALQAIARGAHDFLAKPIDPDVLLVVLARAASRAAMERRIEALQHELAARRPADVMLGRSPPFVQALELADRVAPTDLPVLLTGENGTGKELLARRVHAHSRRRDGPFVPINCGALPPTLLESTLFGHTRGAFTGATGARKGVFAEASGGTLFLDEIGDTEPATQVRLLRAIEAQEVLPVGADRPIAVDVRIVSATNHDLGARIAAGAFRDDLFWRLRGVEVAMPPLRDRGDDILLLARHFASVVVGPAVHLGPDAEEALLAHPWPGNLRELRHAVQRGAVMARPGSVITRAHLALDPLPDAGPDGASLADQVDRLERRVIAAALAAEGGNRSRAARRLGLSRQGLANKLARYE
ncbi:MAG: sigma-54 dependent transcriptional regulator [Myxococcota bacterium]